MISIREKICLKNHFQTISISLNLHLVWYRPEKKDINQKQNASCSFSEGKIIKSKCHENDLLVKTSCLCSQGLLSKFGDQQFKYSDF